MSVRLVITDAIWDRIEPLMPADPVRGRRWADHRRTLEAIAWKYRTNSPWRDLPEPSALPGHSSSSAKREHSKDSGKGRFCAPIDVYLAGHWVFYLWVNDVIDRFGPRDW
ncbi:transposase [Streptomyces flaveolus]|uniref:transposase n=1 Tax=Streptomyces flaveolus TaxID=67297 RepID=UPI0036F5DEDA